MDCRFCVHTKLQTAVQQQTSLVAPDQSLVSHANETFPCYSTLGQLNGAFDNGLVFMEKMYRKRLHGLEALPTNYAKQLLSVRIEVANNGHLVKGENTSMTS